jgi:simple sugar transport system ATP-binding protein
MDEPTSVLTPQEVERLFATLRRLSGEGRAILYISHKLEEIRALCERATIMRGGRVVAERDPRRESARRLAELMIGNELRAPAHRKTIETAQGPRFVVKRLSLRSEQEFGVALKDVSFSIAGGEILGIGGVAGNGQTELMAALSGETLADRADAILIDGKPVGTSGPGARRKGGATFVPEERYGHGAVSNMTLAENAFLTAFRRLGLVQNQLISIGGAFRFADRIISSFDVRTTGAQAEARSLSGGNLQKFILGREILQAPGVLIVSQPTWGVDAGAAAAIHQALLDLADAGAAVLIISQDLDEIFAICDRIAVVYQGRLSEARPIGEVTVEEIGLLMGGAHPEAQGRLNHARPA